MACLLHPIAPVQFRPACRSLAGHRAGCFRSLCTCRIVPCTAHWDLSFGTGVRGVVGKGSRARSTDKCVCSARHVWRRGAPAVFFECNCAQTILADNARYAHTHTHCALWTTLCRLVLMVAMCCMISVGLISVEVPVSVRCISPQTPLSYKKKLFLILYLLQKDVETMTHECDHVHDDKSGNRPRRGRG